MSACPHVAPALKPAARSRRVVVVLPHDDRGSGAAVVLVHAGIADRSMWHEHLDWLVDCGYRAIAVDLPGFGDATMSGARRAPWGDVVHRCDPHSQGCRRLGLKLRVDHRGDRRVDVPAL